MCVNGPPCRYLKVLEKISLQGSLKFGKNWRGGNHPLSSVGVNFHCLWNFQTHQDILKRLNISTNGFLLLLQDISDFCWNPYVNSNGCAEFNLLPNLQCIICRTLLCRFRLGVAVCTLAGFFFCSDVDCSTQIFKWYCCVAEILLHREPAVFLAHSFPLRRVQWGQKVAGVSVKCTRLFCHRLFAYFITFSQCQFRSSVF